MKHYSKQIFLFLFLVSIGIQGLAQTPTGFSIKGKISGLKDTTVFLAHYFGYNQQVIKDTAQVDAEGQFHFKGTKELPEGLYLIALPKGRYLDIVIGNTSFSFQTDTVNLIGKMKVTGSKENELFFGFQQEMSAKFEKLKQLDAQRRQKKDAASEAAFKKHQAEIETFQKTWLEQNKGSFVVKLIKAAQEPEVPAFGKPVVTKADSSAMYQFQFNYYKSHFWDNFDLGDERLLRTPFYQKKLERYFEDLTVQQSDSISKEADKILNKVKSRDMRRYTIYKISSTYENPKILGVDGAFVHMAEKYYIGEPALWDTSTVRKMKERIAIVKPLLNGMPFPQMYLTDTLGREIDIRRIPAEYTVVFIYDPECSHCRESAPKLSKMYPALKAKNIRVLAASIDRSSLKWKKFIKEFKFEQMINGIDIHKNPQTGKEEYYTDFKNLFDVYATPVIYVLDKDKKIIAKRLPLEQIEDFIDFHKKQNQTIKK